MGGSTPSPYSADGEIHDYSFPVSASDKPITDFSSGPVIPEIPEEFGFEALQAEYGARLARVNRVTKPSTLLHQQAPLLHHTSTKGPQREPSTSLKQMDYWPSVGPVWGPQPYGPSPYQPEWAFKQRMPEERRDSGLYRSHPPPDFEVSLAKAFRHAAARGNDQQPPV
ncbi:hypothetical protein H0H87_004571 [Tephrocybe sp. NHM501043]|nr:hypothetical protein H0H87_004571 [Tephrocybe sp. NHM501043]